MSTEKFFDETLEQSQVKSLIVSKYFWAWAKVILATAKRNRRTPKLAYIDLFAGPGRYKDGTKSTPIMILEKVVLDERLRNSLVTIFNDSNREYFNSLKSTIDEIKRIKDLRYQPQILNEEIHEKTVNHFKEIKLIPTLFFIDPWGYKGLTFNLINSVIKDWGCDCIFFFNYNRINMGLNNVVVKNHIDSLFGIQRAEDLRKRIENLSSEQRELLILEELTQALIEMGAKFTLPFVFKSERGTRTSHHLIFVSKNFKGYEIMKEIMAKESSSADQEVPSFGYNPADINTPLLFELSRPLDDLGEMLLKEFAGKEMTMREIYISHNVGKPYIEKNYKSILRKLEKEQKIVVDPPEEKRQSRMGEKTFGPKVKVKFPN